MKAVFETTKNSISITYKITDRELDEKAVQTIVKTALKEKYVISIHEDDYEHRSIVLHGLSIKNENIKEQIEKLK